MNTFRMQLQLCPECGYELDAATKVQGDKGAPEPGDVTVCMGCASVLEFGPELELSVANLDDMPADMRRRWRR
jgi:hypothetical protein